MNKPKEPLTHTSTDSNSTNNSLENRTLDYRKFLYSEELKIFLGKDVDVFTNIGDIRTINEIIKALRREIYIENLRGVLLRLNGEQNPKKTNVKEKINQKVKNLKEIVKWKFKKSNKKRIECKRDRSLFKFFNLFEEKFITLNEKKINSIESQLKECLLNWETSQHLKQEIKSKNTSILEKLLNLFTEDDSDEELTEKRKRK